ncbi:MAG: MFS transporter [Isosphaeraceae bacterium]|nr:MFS transporter [Isosphaeraceae bacterium]
MRPGRAFPPTLWLLATAHFLVDLYAATINPLWPDLQRGLRLGDGAIQWAFLSWSLASSVSQLFFGYWGDRARGRWLLWLGPGAGVVALSSVGWATSFPALCVLLLVAGLGIAAFHPEAAAMAGASAPGRRSQAMSVFAVGGYLGQAIGPIYSGVITTHSHIRTLAWGMTWGLVALALLAWALRRRAGDFGAVPVTAPVSLTELLRGRGVATGLVLAIGVLRILPSLGVPLALAYLLKGRGASNETVGMLQAIFLGGVGAGSLGCALFVRPALERRVLWTLPLLVTPLLLAMPALPSGVLVLVVGVAGVLLGMTLPILVSYGQRLLPEGQRVASSITMGVTWGLGGAIVAATMAGCNHAQRPDLAFWVFAAGALLSGVLCAWLPEPESLARVRAAAEEVLV